MEMPAELEARIDEVITHYPVSKRSAALPLLHLIQEQFGYIEEDAIDMGRQETRSRTDQRAGTGDFLSDVSAGTGWETSHPSLPHALLRHGGRLRTAGHFLQTRRNQPATQRAWRSSLEERGR